MSSIMDIKATSPSKGNDFKNEVMDWEMQQILAKLKGINIKKISYVYAIMLFSELGIARQSAVIKAIAKVQDILGKIIGDINKLEQLLEELEQRGFGNTWVPATKGHWSGKKWYDPNSAIWTFGKPGHFSNTPYDPSDKKTDYDNRAQMERQIKKWLQEKTDLKGPDGKPLIGPDGKPLTNAGALRYLWKDLFGTGKNGNDGLMGQLKDALQNPIYKQHLGSGYSEITGWDKGGSPLAGGKWSWNNGWGSNTHMSSFLDFLQGKDGSVDDLAHALATAFCASYYNKTGTKPEKNKGVPIDSDDDVGNLISQNFEIGKQTENGLNSTESADLSMTSQNLMSIIQIVEKIIQLVASETQHTTSKMGQV